MVAASPCGFNECVQGQIKGVVVELPVHNRRTLYRLEDVDDETGGEDGRQHEHHKS